MKKVTRIFFDKNNESINFLKFEINRMNVKKFESLPVEDRAPAIEWYNDCIKTLEVMRDELKKTIE